jgi:tetratricopeptide (TPR) repeat protein
MHGLIVALLLLTPPAGAAPPPDKAAVSFDLLAQRARDAQQQNRSGEALDLFRQAVALRPAWDEGWWSIGMITYDRDNFTDCTSAFRRLRSLKPDLAPGWIMSGLCEYGLRQYDAAYRSLLQAELLGFEGSAELARVGRLHLILLLTKNSNFEHALMLCGLLFRSNTAPPETVAAAGLAGLFRPLLPIEVPPEDRPLVQTVGEAFAAAYAKPVPEAIAKFEAALQSYPNVPAIHYRFGAYLLKNDPARGLAEIRRALEIDPAYVPSLLALSVESLDSGDYESAQRYAAKAAQAAPANYAPHLMLGRAFLLESKSLDLKATAGNATPAPKTAPAGKSVPAKSPSKPSPLKQALRELELAVKLEPDSQDAHFSLIAAYTMAGRATDAARERTQYERLRKLATARTGL